MKQNYRTKLGLGYEEAKFNYLNNNRANFLVFLYVILSTFIVSKLFGIASLALSELVRRV